MIDEETINEARIHLKNLKNFSDKAIEKIIIHLSETCENREEFLELFYKKYLSQL